MLFSASVALRGRTSAGGGLMGQNFKLFQLLFGHKSNLVITMTLQSSLMDTRHSGKKNPPLSSRLREGMTFSEFSRQTTKQYYGGGGIQQNS